VQIKNRAGLLERNTGNGFQKASSGCWEVGREEEKRRRERGGSEEEPGELEGVLDMFRKETIIDFNCERDICKVVRREATWKLGGEGRTSVEGGKGLRGYRSGGPLRVGAHAVSGKL